MPCPEEARAFALIHVFFQKFLPSWIAKNQKLTGTETSILHCNMVLIYNQIDCPGKLVYRSNFEEQTPEGVNVQQQYVHCRQS
jgi:hypothetical protein